MEQWKTLDRLTGYQISNLGRVKSLKRGKEKLLKQSTTKDGYHLVCLFANGLRHTSYIHRLVAEAFLAESVEKIKFCEVNHKDKNPANNHVDNLEWVTPEQNVVHKRSFLLDRRTAQTNYYVDKLEKLCNSMDNTQLQKLIEYGEALSGR